MRRALILLLALVLGLGPAMAAAPASAMELAWTALTGVDGSRLPACCRRNGTHHCMQMAGAAGKGASVSASDSCPYSSQLPASAMSQSATLAAPEVGLRTDVQGCEAPASETINSSFGRRSWSPRGPPSMRAV
jgi:hypothetical protein